MPFTITTPSTSVQLDADRSGEVSFTVFNKTGQTIVGRGLIHLPDDSGEASESWFSISGDRERAIPPEGAEHYTVEISVPAEIPAGTYIFRFDAVDVEDVDERHVAGPAVSIQVPETPPDEPSCRWCIPAAVAIVVLLLVAAAAWWFWPSDDLVEIPQVQGLSTDEAIDELESAGFSVVTVTEFSDTVEEETVIDTNPPAEESLEEGGEIVLVVSAGQDLVEIPEVEDLDQNEAIAKLEEACEPTPCFAVELDREIQDGGIVVDTDPPEGESAAPGSEVRISSVVRIPDLRGEAYDDARDTLRTLCQPRPCFSVNWDGYGQRGIVSGTDPDEGETAEPGTDITVATGVEIPPVGNNDVEDATTLIENACEPAPCFEVTTQTEFTSALIFQNRILGLDPGAGEIVQPGTEVTIRIGVYDGPLPDIEDPPFEDDFPIDDFPVIPTVPPEAERP